MESQKQRSTRGTLQKSIIQTPFQCKGYIFYKSKLLGAGAFATVYQGHKECNPEYQVAVKVFNQSLNNIQSQTMIKFVEQIIQQITVQQNVNKDCVVNIIQNGKVKMIQRNKEVQKYCIITQYMNEGTLQEIYPEYEQNDQQQIIQIIKKIVNCYKGLYQKNIVHRDLKPQNIMVKTMGKLKIIKLADFGTSRYTSSQTRRTKVGTPQYQSPQQAFGLQQKSGKCDVYALGGIFFRLLCGFPPIRKFINQKTLKANIKEIDQCLKEQKISQKSIQFICKCLQYDQNSRYSWEEVFEHPIFTGVKTIQLFPNFDNLLIKDSYISDRINPKISIRTDQIHQYIQSKETLPRQGNYVFSIRPIKLDGKNNARIGLIGLNQNYSLKYKTVIQSKKNIIISNQTYYPKPDQCLNQVPSIISVGLNFEKMKISWTFNGKTQLQIDLQQDIFDYKLFARVCFEEYNDSFQFI